MSESPDGRLVDYTAPVNNVMNIWVGPLDNLTQIKPITNDTGRGIYTYSWMWDSRAILYAQDINGDENCTIYHLDETTGEKLALTPCKNVSASISDTSQKVPGEVILALNDRNPSYHDLYLVNLTTGDKKLLIKKDDFSYFVLDDDCNIRFAGNTTPDG